MYIVGWLTLVIISLAISLIAFLWALESGQFSDQDRTRYLPLIDLPESAPAGPHRSRRGAYGLLVVIALGTGAIIAPIVLTLYHLLGG
jgi:cbb3-type cytochrome oxidase maturation protein